MLNVNKKKRKKCKKNQKLVIFKNYKGSKSGCLEILEGFSCAPPPANPLVIKQPPHGTGSIYKNATVQKSSNLRPALGWMVRGRF